MGLEDNVSIHKRDKKDKGTNSISETLKELTKLLEFKKIRTTPTTFSPKPSILHESISRERHCVLGHLSRLCNAI